MTTSILVTGGAGYIGSHTCKALRQAGFAPIAYDNLSRGNAEAANWGELVIGDLADRALLRATLERHRPAAEDELAAFAYVGESNENPAACYRNKGGIAGELLSAMRQRDFRRIVLSRSWAV